MAKLKIKDITKLKYSDYAKFDEDKLLKYAKQALSYSIAGAKSAQEALKSTLIYLSLLNIERQKLKLL